MRIAVTIASASLLSGSLMGQPPLRLPNAQYEDRVLAAWTGQIIATLMGFQFEHKTASALWIDRFPKPDESAPVDDDYYYELVALRGFERYGIDMTLDELGEQWKENSAGSWGSSEQARLRLVQGVKGSETGHPRYNKLWFTIGPQFSGRPLRLAGAGRRQPGGTSGAHLRPHQRSCGGGGRRRVRRGNGEPGLSNHRREGRGA